jgi:hypothetical protein
LAARSPSPPRCGGRGEQLFSVKKRRLALGRLDCVSRVEGDWDEAEIYAFGYEFAGERYRLESWLYPVSPHN